ncbi:MAG: LuxR C-terminal-related transcriptional regulator [Pseudonocardia sp.]|nr:LuxR C-terminal-related transcriptional regulator [Pseudonocardia sp.]
MSRCDLGRLRDGHQRAGGAVRTPRSPRNCRVSRKTVSSHLEHIYLKLGVRTRTEAALFAMRTGLLGTEDAPAS